jgi:hypothetical protein
MATKKKTAKKTYTVRIEWPVTYYCDTTVEASSIEEAARLAMEDPDYDNQRSYDESGDSAVEGVCEGEEYDFSQHQEVGGSRDADGDGAAREHGPKLLKMLRSVLDAIGEAEVDGDEKVITSAMRFVERFDGDNA